MDTCITQCTHRVLVTGRQNLVPCKIMSKSLWSTLLTDSKWRQLLSFEKLQKDKELKVVTTSTPFTWSYSYPSPEHYWPKSVIDLAVPVKPVEKGSPQPPAILYLHQPDHQGSYVWALVLGFCHDCLDHSHSCHSFQTPEINEQLLFVGLLVMLVLCCFSHKMVVGNCCSYHVSTCHYQN